MCSLDAAVDRRPSGDENGPQQDGIDRDPKDQPAMEELDEKRKRSAGADDR
jgi:hypothetical protein